MLHRLPIICAEGEQGQASGIAQIAQQEVAETVTNGNRLFYLRTADNETLVPSTATRLPEMLSLGRMEHTVSTCNLETLNIREATHASTLVVEVNHDLVVLDIHLLERRTLTDNRVESVGLIQREKCQALAHLLLLGRMNLQRLVGIDSVIDTHQSAIGNNLRSTELLFAQQRTAQAVHVVTVVGIRYPAQIKIK